MTSEPHRVSGLSAAQQSEATVVFLAAALCFPELLRTLVVGQVEHFLRLPLILHLQQNNKHTFITHDYLDFVPEGSF